MNPLSRNHLEDPNATAAGGTRAVPMSLFLFISLSVLVSLTACSKTAGGPNSATPNGSPAANGPTSSVSVVKVGADAVQIPAGGSANATVRVTIQSGYHVNANPATEVWLKATELTLQNVDGVSVGFVTYPSAITKTFSFSKKPLAVYEGETTITVMLNATKSAAKGQRSLAATLHVQACDDQVCYPPGVVELTIPVTVN